jgi:hypothetical protein
MIDSDIDSHDVSNKTDWCERKLSEWIRTTESRTGFKNSMSLEDCGIALQSSRVRNQILRYTNNSGAAISAYAVPISGPGGVGGHDVRTGTAIQLITCLRARRFGSCIELNFRSGVEFRGQH